MERSTLLIGDFSLAQNVPVIYTRSAGAATIEWRGSDWEVRTMSGMRISSRNPVLVPKPVTDRQGEEQPAADDEGADSL